MSFFQKKKNVIESERISCRILTSTKISDKRKLWHYNLSPYVLLNSVSVMSASLVQLPVRFAIYRREGQKHAGYRTCYDIPTGNAQSNWLNIVQSPFIMGSVCTFLMFYKWPSNRSVSPLNMQRSSTVMRKISADAYFIS